jgi:hypothetical protein
MPSVTPVPDLILYTRAGCSLCDEARDAIRLVTDDRRARGLVTPGLVEVDIEAEPELHRRLFERIPVVQLGEQRVELIVTVGKVRRLLSEVVGDAPAQPDEPATPHDPAQPGSPAQPVCEWS